MTQFAVCFGMNLKEARQAAGFSQAALALRLGVSISTYGSFESGKKIPNVWTARKISETLGISTEKLLFPEKNL